MNESPKKVKYKNTWYDIESDSLYNNIWILYNKTEYFRIAMNLSDFEEVIYQND